VETIGSKQSYALTWCMPNNDVMMMMTQVNTPQLNLARQAAAKAVKVKAT